MRPDTHDGCGDQPPMYLHKQIALSKIWRCPFPLNSVGFALLLVPRIPTWGSWEGGGREGVCLYFQGFTDPAWV